MYNDRQTLLEQTLPEETTRHTVSTNHKQPASASSASNQRKHFEPNVQDESDYIDSWYDGLIGTSEDS